MKKKRTQLLILSWIFLMVLVSHKSNGQTNAAASVSFRHVRIEDGFWSQRQKVLVESALPHAFGKMQATFENFAVAGKLREGQFKGTPWDDHLSFHLMQAAAASLAWHPDKELEKKLDEYISWIGAAMEPDGYIYAAKNLLSKEQLKNWVPERWINMRFSHEELSSAYLINAACTHHEVTGKTNLLSLACRNADLFSSLFHPGGLNYLTGHEGLKMALVRLYHETGERRYFDCAQYLLNNRCAPREKLLLTRRDYPESYFQSHLPVREQREVVGHQVRAGFLYSAMADIAMETGDTTLTEALEALWTDFVSHKMYIHGGCNGFVESFEAPYFLPNDNRAYCETCSAVTMVSWNYRMALLLRDAKYIDVMERSLFNNSLGGIGMDGKSFNYCNPLEAEKDKPADKTAMRAWEWPPLPCCPPMIMRLIATIGEYFYATAPGAIYVNLYGESTGNLNVDGMGVTLRQETKYPWEGHIRLKVGLAKAKDFTVHLRIPGWAQGRPVPSDLYRYEDAKHSDWTIKVNGERVKTPALEKGYAVVKRTWKSGDIVELDLPMPVRSVLSNDKVEYNRRRTAYERGPLVYCAEGIDNKLPVKELMPVSTSWNMEFHPELLGGVMVLQGLDKAKMDSGFPDDECELKLVPYFTWGNRDAGDMIVWMNRKE